MANNERDKFFQIISFKRLRPEATLPTYAHEGDAAFDLFSCEDKTLAPREFYKFDIGWASEVPSGFFVRFAPKSGLALRAGIDVLGGVIDAGYRGEWGVILINLGDKPYEVKAGDKIAQGLLLKVEFADIKEVDGLSSSERGDAGFGSTGS